MPQAIKDCRTCNRRRIRCDRAFPACSKCVSRKLSCPGYEKPLRWINGAVSKGPYRQDFQPRGPDLDIQTTSHKQSVENQDDRTTRTNYLWPNSQSTPRLEFSVLADFRTPFVEYQNFQAEAISLLKHFTEVIANQLAWYDDDANPWRNLIVPLAFSSRTLFTAILAMSAGNILSRMENSYIHTSIHFQSMQFHRHNALNLLSKDFQDIRSFSATPWLPSHSQLGKATLASVIVLSYLEIHFPTSGVWRLHLNGAREVLRAVQKPPVCDRTMSFLVEELSAATTWPLLTNYNLDMPTSNDDVELQDLLGTVNVPDQASGFSGFCLALRLITLTERLSQQSKSDGISCVDTEAAFAEIDQTLSQAWSSTLKTVRPERLWHSKLEGRDVKYLIDAYYHATAVYKFQALRRTTKDGYSIESHRFQLLQSLLAFHDLESFAQDQAWPLFIAGTESKGDAVSQDWISCRFRRIIHCSCALDRPRVMSFLEQFWSQTDHESWIDYGRQRASDLASFLIL
ncbi:fungal-specific transcription factor domain-containing protein [Rhexocercosporidium sp. MPI-PUGE-AT-0058]|nr:fungal-specific transcription factor domain-containing protein [Rhexocercosporidium sp. MPI-PUGE-AT-0058]